MHRVTLDEVRDWYRGSSSLSEFTRSIGSEPVDQDYLAGFLGFPLHLEFVVRALTKERGVVAADALDSLPFYSVCRGLLLPLSMMTSERAGQLFGIEVPPPPTRAERDRLLEQFVSAEVGLDLEQKVACVLGDPFRGRRSTLRRDSLLQLLMSMQLVSRTTLLDRLTVVGDVAVLFAERIRDVRREPRLTAAEVLETVRFLPDVGRRRRFELLRSLLERCGRMEAYFLVKLVMRKAGFGFQYEGPLLAQLIAQPFQADPEHVAHAVALTDPFRVVRTLQDEGVDGLRAIQLQPLVAVRPALAGGTTDDLDRFPVWVERKYDGVRLMLHRVTDRLGSTVCGAYSRNRGDFLGSVPGLEATIRAIPAAGVIVDGELYGTVVDVDGVRPATVYEVFGVLQGEASRPVQLRYAAFDLLHLNGADLTQLPLAERRQRLSMLLGLVQGMPLPVPVTVAEGQLVQGPEDLNRLYRHYRAQGYEGVITKDLNGAYTVAARDPSWRKRKPEVTLDLVLLGAVYAVTSKEHAHLFGSYVIGARTADGGYLDVGDVAGVDRVRDAEIQQTIMREGLLTGARIERASASGVRPGLELRPYIVVTVRFEGVVKESATGKLSLRDPKLVMIRADKTASEADSERTIEELHLRQRVG